MYTAIADTDQLIRLLYRSRASSDVQGHPDRHMSEILAEAVIRNSTINVTGALLYCDGWFIQGLEGLRSQIGGVFGLIASDRRHGTVTQISAGPIERREFASWSMCGATLTPKDDAIVEMLESRELKLDKQPPAAILKLLKTVVTIKERDHVVLI